MLTYEEATTIAIDFLSLRDKVKKENTTELKTEYKKAQKEIVSKLSYLVDMIVAKYRKFPNYDDLKQDGLEALMCSFDSFKPGKGDFIWWARAYIKTRISRCANKHSTVRFPLKKCKDLIPYKTTGMPVIVDEDNNADRFISQRETIDHAHELLETLPPSHRDVVKLCIMENMTIKNISNILKLKRTEVIKIYNESIEILKEQKELLEE